MKLNFAKESDIVAGRVLYSTCVLKIDGTSDYSTNITKEIITSKPFASKNTGSTFYNSIKIVDGLEYNGGSSLKDKNIPENGYNYHQMFTDLESAELYCEMFRTQQFDYLFDIGVVTLKKFTQIEENRQMTKHMNSLLDSIGW